MQMLTEVTIKQEPLLQWKALSEQEGMNDYQLLQKEGRRLEGKRQM